MHQWINYPVYLHPNLCKVNTKKRKVTCSGSFDEEPCQWDLLLPQSNLGMYPVSYIEYQIIQTLSQGNFPLPPIFQVWIQVNQVLFLQYPPPHSESTIDHFNLKRKIKHVRKSKDGFGVACILKQS